MVLFIAAPALIRGMFRLRASRGGGYRPAREGLERMSAGHGGSEHWRDDEALVVQSRGRRGPLLDGDGALGTGHRAARHRPGHGPRPGASARTTATPRSRSRSSPTGGTSRTLRYPRRRRGDGAGRRRARLRRLADRPRVHQARRCASCWSSTVAAVRPRLPVLGGDRQPGTADQPDRPRPAIGDRRRSRSSSARSPASSASAPASSTSPSRGRCSSARSPARWSRPSRRALGVGLIAAVIARRPDRRCCSRCSRSGTWSTRSCSASC